MQPTSHVSFEQFAKMLGKTWQGVAEWYKAGYLPVTIQKIGGHDVRVVSKEYADGVKVEWDLSCPPIEASRKIGIPERGGSLRGLIEKKIVKTINPLGNGLGPTRVLLSSIPVAQGYMAGSEERLRKLRRAKAAEMSKKRWAKRRLLVGTRRLMSLKKAAKVLGKKMEDVKALAENFTLRTFNAGGEVLVYASSVEAFKRRAETKKEPAKYQRAKFQYRQFSPPSRVRRAVSEGDSIESDPDEPQELGVGRGDGRHYDE